MPDEVPPVDPELEPLRSRGLLVEVDVLPEEVPDEVRFRGFVVEEELVVPELRTRRVVVAVAFFFFFAAAFFAATAFLARIFCAFVAPRLRRLCPLGRFTPTALPVP